MAAPNLSSLLTEQAVDNLVYWLGSLPDVDETLAAAGLTRTALRKVQSDDEITAALETRREAVVAAPWRLEPWADNQVAEWLWAEVEPHLPQLIRDVWHAVPYGYSVVEAVYARKADGRIGLARVGEKPFEWFTPQRDGSLLYSPPTIATPVTVDTQFKFFLTRREATYRQPYGVPLLSALYWPWYFRSNGWRFWARFLERHGAPLLVGKSGDTASMQTALVAAINSAVLSIDREDEIASVGAGAAGDAFDKFSTAVDKRIQKVVLGQTLTTDVGKTGSYAAAKVQNEVRGDRLAADITLVQATIQRLVDALRLLNFPLSDRVSFMIADDRGLEVERTDRDVKLVSGGVLKLTEKYLLDRYDFEEGDFTVPAPVTLSAPDQELPPAPAGEPEAAPLSAQRFAVGGSFTPDQNEIEELVSLSIPEGGQPVPVAAIKRAIAASSSPAELAERLAALYAGGEYRDFQAVLERALFAADVVGYASAAGKV